ncbi:hypothetical protein HYQ46_010875 [Verticillium longisporum]|nr:hypothetical protein HYQ46_010875 [Verticillium longisporum]
MEKDYFRRTLRLASLLQNPPPYETKLSKRQRCLSLSLSSHQHEAKNASRARLSSSDKSRGVQVAYSYGLASSTGWSRDRGPGVAVQPRCQVLSVPSRTCHPTWRKRQLFFFMPDIPVYM